MIASKVAAARARARLYRSEALLDDMLRLRGLSERAHVHFLQAIFNGTLDF